jgi:dolichyl-phosphate-mannose--protein O-mannosyl transferase
MYYVHFALLVNKGTGASLMSPEFQYSLRGNTMPETFMGFVEAKFF